MAEPDNPHDLDFAAHPHDAYFKKVFSEPAHAAAFFQRHLPARVAAAMDWAGLQVLPGSFVKTSLEQVHADLLFSVNLAGRPTLLYLLLEHQSSVDPLMPLRMLVYVTEILLGHAREIGLPLPMVFPFVLHQGPEQWAVSPCLEQMFDLPEDLSVEVLPFLPKFRHGLLDLTRFDPDGDKSDLRLRAVLQFMKLARERDVRGLLLWMIEDARQSAHRLPEGLLKTTLLYALHCDTRVDAAQIIDILSGSAEYRETTMTIAQQLKAEGQAEAKAEGSYIGRLQLLQELMGLPVAAYETLSRLGGDELQARCVALHGEYELRFKKA